MRKQHERCPVRAARNVVEGQANSAPGILRPHKKSYPSIRIAFSYGGTP